MSIEQYANNASSTLNGAINNSVTSIVLTDASAFPAGGNFRIKCENELMLCTARSSNTLTVTRGAEGTAGASHADLTGVYHIMTKQSLLNILAEGIANGDFSARPAVGRPGRVFIPNDGLTIGWEDGSNFYTFGPAWKFAPQPAFAAGGTWMAQNNALAVDEFDGLHYYDTGGQAGTDVYSFLHKTIPTPGSPWTFTAAFIPQMYPNGSGSNCGIAVGNSSDNKCYLLQAQFDSVSLTGFGNVCQGNNGTPGTVVANTQSPKGVWPQFYFFKIVNDGTNLTFWVSTDYRHWLKRYTIALGSSYIGSTPNWYGPYLNNFNTSSGSQSQMFFLELKLTQP